MESSRRHQRIAKLQAKIVAGVVGVIMALTTASGIYQAVQNSQAEDTATQVQNRAEFWKVVAGEQPASSPNVQTKLAIELRDNLGAKSVQVTSLPSGIEEFRAGANDFSGIEAQIGMNPFNPGALKCETCGALSIEMKDKLLFIKQDKLDQVLSSEQAAVSTDRGLNLTPFDISLPLWIGLVYTSATTAVLVIAIRVDAKRFNYAPNMLNWKYEGGSTSDPYRKFSRRLSPLYVPIVLKLERKFDKSKDGDEVLESMALSESQAKLRQALELIGKLPATERQRPDVVAQKATIESLLADISEQVDNFVGYQPMSVGHSVDSRIAAIQSLTDEAALPIEARRQAIQEVDGGDSTSQPKGQTATG